MMMRGTISPAARLVDVLRTEKSIRQIFNEIVGLSIRERGNNIEFVPADLGRDIMFGRMPGTHLASDFRRSEQKRRHAVLLVFFQFCSAEDLMRGEVQSSGVPFSYTLSAALAHLAA
jgi:hypothetical protein